MKNFFTKMMVIAVMLFAGSALMTACTPDIGSDDYKGPPVLEVGEPEVVSAIEVNIPLNAKKLATVGYQLKEKVDGAEPTPPANAMLLYRGGKEIKGCPQSINLTGNDGLDRDKTFVLYVAATISDSEFYNNGEIFSVEFTTPDNYADKDIIVRRTTTEGAEIVVQIPDQVKQKGHRVKWGVANIAMLNYYGKSPIPEQLHNNEVMYPAFLFKNDTVLNINHHNAYRRNANGEIGYYYISNYNVDGYGTIAMSECPPTDPMVEADQAEPIQYYQHFQPGEPIVVMMSEVDYADCTLLHTLDGQEYVDHVQAGDCDHKHPMIDFGWGLGWYWYPYDYRAYAKELEELRDPGQFPMPGVGGGNNQPEIDFDKFWHEDAWWKKIELTLPGPEEFTTGSVDVNISALRPNGGKIVFTPTGDTYAYLLGIYPDQSDMGAGFYDLIKTIDGKSEHLQWLTTAEIAPYLGIFPYTGTTVLDLEKDYNGVVAGMKYHIIVNAVPGKMVDGEMTLDVSKQKFQHLTFTLPNYSTPEPEVVVTAYESYSPIKVKFNIKNPNAASNPVKKVVYAANNTRDFDSYMNYYDYTYGDIIMANAGYAYLTEAEVEAVNSDFGFDIEFDVRENSSFTLAVMGWNDEGHPSNPDKEGSKAVAEAKSTPMPTPDPLDMAKLNALKGDWTATAAIETYDYNTGKPVASTRSWKVTIGDLNTNEVLDEEGYAIFQNAGVDKTTADGYLAEYNAQAAEYNKSVLSQNRVLCLGWAIDDERAVSTTSPWDLFLMPDYNASTVDYLFKDFGPKWFLQTDADGNIFVPVNYNLVPQMMSWYDGTNHYLINGNYKDGIAAYIDKANPSSVQAVGIEVAVSEDGNTVTLKSREVSYTDSEGATQTTTLSPNIAFDYNKSLAFYNPYTVSDVVLTRGWNNATTSANKRIVANKGVKKGVVNDGDYKKPTKVFSRTLFPEKKSSETKTVKFKFITKEEMNKNVHEYMSRFNKGARK